MRRPEALLVVPVMPAAQGNGLAMRAGMLLEGLARDHDVRVLVVPVFGGARAPDELTRRLAAQVEVLPLPSTVDAMVARLADAEGRARAERLHPLPEPASQVGPPVADLLASHAGHAAVALVMRLYLAPALDVLLAAPDRPPVALDLDDLDWERERRLGREDEAAAYERLAGEYLPRIDAVLATSARDAEQVGLRSGSTVDVVPNGVRPPIEIRAGAPEHDLLFVGNLSYAPNAAAALWLCREVLPLLDGTTAVVVGSGPPDAVRALAADGRVTVAADVREVAPWYAAARVATAPLHGGAGTRTKILEAWAHCLPVVTTTIGAEGLDVGEAALVADDPAGFADACRRLLDDPALAEALAGAGRERLRESGTAAHSAAVLADLAALWSAR